MNENDQQQLARVYNDLFLSKRETILAATTAASELSALSSRELSQGERDVLTGQWSSLDVLLYHAAWKETEQIVDAARYLGIAAEVIVNYFPVGDEKTVQERLPRWKDVFGPSVDTPLKCLRALADVVKSAEMMTGDNGLRRLHEQLLAILMDDKQSGINEARITRVSEATYPEAAKAGFALLGSREERHNPREKIIVGARLVGRAAAEHHFLDKLRALGSVVHTVAFHPQLTPLAFKQVGSHFFDSKKPSRDVLHGRRLRSALATTENPPAMDVVEHLNTITHVGLSGGQVLAIKRD